MRTRIIMDISGKKSLPVIAAVIITLVFTMTMPIPAEAKSKAKVYKSGIYKVTVNYEEVNGEKKPKSVNIVGSKLITNGPNDKKIVIPEKLKVKIKIGKKIKTYNLPVVQLKKLNTKYLGAIVDLNKAKRLKELGPLKAQIYYKHFRCWNYQGKGIFIDATYDRKKGTNPGLVVPAKVADNEVISISYINGYKYIDISDCKYLQRFDGTLMLLRYKGYLIRRCSDTIDMETGRYVPSLDIEGTYADVADINFEYFL
jgi:hypothetical protein